MIFNKKLEQGTTERMSETDKDYYAMLDAAHVAMARLHKDEQSPRRAGELGAAENEKEAGIIGTGVSTTEHQTTDKNRSKRPGRQLQAAAKVSKDKNGEKVAKPKSEIKTGTKKVHPRQTTCLPCPRPDQMIWRNVNGYGPHPLIDMAVHKAAQQMRGTGRAG